MWSTLPGMKGRSGGKYTRVTHFDAKAAIAEMFLADGVLGAKVSLFVGLYFDMTLRAPALYPITKVCRLAEGTSSFVADRSFHLCRTMRVFTR